MARIEIIVEDTVESGEAGVTVRMESADPSMPLKDGTLDFHAATKSQLFAFGMLVETVGLIEANLMIKTEEAP